MKVGIDMGGMSVKLGLVNEKNEITGKLVIPTRLDVPAREMVLDMAEAVKTLLAENGLTLSQIQGIGIGSPGTVDQEEGTILYSNNFDWEDVPILSIMREALGPVKLDIANDADAAALGEVCAGAAEGAKNAVLLTLGTGVGGGVIINRKNFPGRRNRRLRTGTYGNCGEWRTVYLRTAGMFRSLCFCFGAVKNGQKGRGGSSGILDESDVRQ